MSFSVILRRKVKRLILDAICHIGKSTQIKKYFEKSGLKKLNLGCGTNFLEGWLNTDLLPLSYSVIPLDATKKLPFQDESFDFIFSEHMIEHLTFTQAFDLLRECHRVLKPNGVLRIATPDLEFLVQLFNPVRSELQEKYLDYFINRYWEVSSLPRDPSLVINPYFYKWGHRFIFNQSTLEFILQKTGFRNTKWYSPGKSDRRDLTAIEGHHKLISEEFNNFETMVVEAEKS